MGNNRRANKFLQERFQMTFDHASVSADATILLHKVGPRGIHIDRVTYNNPTGLVAAASNGCIVKLIKNSTVMASWSSLTAAQGAIPVNTFIELVYSATAADLAMVPADVMALFLDIQGTDTLPAGHIVIEGRYL